ncbi:hypothetical protein STEG23_012287 [Scotinomys teguina]
MDASTLQRNLGGYTGLFDNLHSLYVLVYMCVVSVCVEPSCAKYPEEVVQHHRDRNKKTHEAVLQGHCGTKDNVTDPVECVSSACSYP